MAANRTAVRIEGLSSFRRALRKADRELDTKVRLGFVAIAKRVADEARSVARSKGLVKSGDMIRGIKPSVRTRDIGVRSTATHRGFNYPRRLEFENKGGSRFGPLATLNPAAERHEPELEAQAIAVIEGTLGTLSGRSLR